MSRATFASRSLFPHLEARAYLAHAAISPPSVRVLGAAHAVLQDYAQQGVGAFPKWLGRREQLRAKLALLLGAQPAEIALTQGTTRGISDLALSLPWSQGDRVVLFEGEFPGNVTPWQCAARLHGLQLRFLPAEAFRRSEGLERLEKELAHGARLVAVSAVQFQTGLRMPLAAIGALCRKYGGQLFVDAIQALGGLPIDVETAQIDYLSAGSHKWLMGLEGSGILYVRAARQASLKPHTAGWLSHEHGTDFLSMGGGHLRYDRALKQEASVFEGGAPNVVGLAALEAAVETHLELGTEAIARHIQRYNDRAEALATELGLVSLRSPDRELQSGLLCFDVPAPHDPVAVHARLQAAGIASSLPDGKLRFAPHFPNSLDELPIVAEALRAALAQGK